jgi:hypothetical protein
MSAKLPVCRSMSLSLSRKSASAMWTRASCASCAAASRARASA